ncbi:hypothetical protein BH23BAC2_BH23BAC2_22610 [soil metagenome]
MKIYPFLKSLLTSPARSRRKWDVKNDLITNTQLNKGIVNIYRKNPNNAGDLYSAPNNYFKELGKCEVDIFDFKKREEIDITRVISDNALIIGGGGLMNRKSFQMQMETFEILASRGKKTVLWGVGHNSKYKKDFRKLEHYNINTNGFGLVGTRDYSLSTSWVPCASCMHPLLDQNYASTREVGIILHDKTFAKPAITSKFEEFDIIPNTADLKSFIQFIGTSENIITNSYHAMYWGILLKKKVTVVPNSSKFFDFKYDPVFSTFDDCLNDYKKSRCYDGVLEDCRQRNLDFAEKVFNYLEV